MPSYSKIFKAHSDIITLQVLENQTALYATASSGVRLLELQEESYQTKYNILFEELTKRTQSVTFSHDAKFIALANRDVITIIELSTRKIVKKIILDNMLVTLMEFHPTSQYLLVGTNKGRVLQYYYKSNKVLSRLCSFPHHMYGEEILKITTNFVSAFAFEGNQMACSGYGGSIYVFNLYARDNTQIITRSRARIDTLVFLEEHTLLSGNCEGVLEVIDLQETKKVCRINTSFTKITNIIPMANKEYVLVSSDANYISLVNIKEMKIVNHKYLEFDGGIKKIIHKDDESLLVILEDSTVLQANITNTNTLKELIQNDKLLQAFKLLSSTPLLKGSQEQHHLEDAYKNKQEEAIKALIASDIHYAKDLLRPFRQIVSKQEEIGLIFAGFAHYDKFKVHFHEKKYALGYSMSEKYPALQYTPEYKSMEKTWKNSFQIAQKYVLHNDLESARVVLNDYIPVTSKRPLIQFILYKNKELLTFLEAIEKKKFDVINSLIKENHFFSQMQHYKVFGDKIESNVYKAKELIKSGNIGLAKIFIEELEDNASYDKEVSQLQEQCKQVNALYNAYNKNDILYAYELLDSKTFLKSVDLGKHLELSWNKTIQECEIYALRGNIEKIQKCLGTLVTLNSRHEKIGDLLRLAYQVSIQKYLSKHNFTQCACLIEKYASFFGLDNEIKILIKLYAKASHQKVMLTKQQAQRKPKDFWLYTEEFLLVS